MKQNCCCHSIQEVDLLTICQISSKETDMWLSLQSNQRQNHISIRNINQNSKHPNNNCKCSFKNPSHMYIFHFKMLIPLDWIIFRWWFNIYQGVSIPILAIENGRINLGQMLVWVVGGNLAQLLCHQIYFIHPSTYFSVCCLWCTTIHLCFIPGSFWILYIKIHLLNWFK